MSYIFGILVIVLGTFLVIKTPWFVETFGTSTWAEEHMGGGTYTFYKLVGLIMIFVSMMGMTGILGGIIMSVFGNLFPHP